MAIQQAVENDAQHGPAKKARMLRVLVVDNAKDGHPTVNVKLPIGVVRWGMKVAEAFSPELRDAKLDWDSITKLIDEGELGKIAEIEDEAANKTVEVFVE